MSRVVLGSDCEIVCVVQVHIERRNLSDKSPLAI
jgi:hypothetical protein